MPEGLLWYPHEPEWQSLAKGRLELGTRIVTCKVTKRSLKELSSELSFGLESLGLSVGGDSNEEAEETVEFHADFREQRLPHVRALLVGLAVVTTIAVASVVWLSH